MPSVAAGNQHMAGASTRTTSGLLSLQVRPLTSREGMEIPRDVCQDLDMMGDVPYHMDSP